MVMREAWAKVPPLLRQVLRSIQVAWKAGLLHPLQANYSRRHSPAVGEVQHALQVLGVHLRVLALALAAVEPDGADEEDHS